jgi:hypothetical protein
LDTVRKKADRAITAAEVKTWFGKTKQQRLRPDIYGKIAADLTRLRWPSDPPPKDRYGHTESESGLWDIKVATKAAKTLLDDMPAMLSHWHEPKRSPEHQVAHKAVSALNEALNTAMPFIEWPLGPYKASLGRKKPKNWHVPSIVIARLVIDALVAAGEVAPGITHNSVTVRVVQKALIRMEFPYCKTLAREAIGAHLKRWSQKYGGLAQKKPTVLVTK